MCRRCIDAVQAMMQPNPMPTARATTGRTSVPLPVGAGHSALVNRLLGPFGPDAEPRRPVIATATAVIATASATAADYDDLMSVDADNASDSTRPCQGPYCMGRMPGLGLEVFSACLIGPFEDYCARCTAHLDAQRERSLDQGPNEGARALEPSSSSGRPPAVSSTDAVGALVPPQSSTKRPYVAATASSTASLPTTTTKAARARSGRSQRRLS